PSTIKMGSNLGVAAASGYASSTMYRGAAKPLENFKRLILSSDCIKANYECTSRGWKRRDFHSDVQYWLQQAYIVT
ncbi:hypothetical protein M8C21_014895, partial [Ambrosia artemisiifolia]